ncbi:MAG: hypothetical protein P1U65_18190 [Minwuia sp.]|nr:hypothetical protein [Minwuia sp.]
MATGDTPQTVRDAIAALPDTHNAGLCSLIEQLYASGAELGQPRFEALLGRVRQDLRRSIDRRMEVAA